MFSTKIDQQTHTNGHERLDLVEVPENGVSIQTESIRFDEEQPQ